MGVKPLPNGKWQADWRDRHEERHRKRYRTRKAAERAERQGRDDREAGIASKRAPTFHGAATNWLERKIAAGKRPASIEQWQSHVRHLSRVLGERRLDRLDVDDLEAALAQLKCPTGTLGFKTIAKVRVTLRAIYADAARRYRLRWNPAMHLAPDGEAASTRVRATEPDVAIRLLEAAAPGCERALLLLFASKGLRHSEALALTWPHIAFSTTAAPGQVRVERSLGWIGDPTRPGRRTPQFGPTKSKSGARALPLDPVLERDLKLWKLECPRSRLQLVFPTVLGEPMHRSAVWRLLQRIIKRAKLAPKVTTIHQLRHYFASALLALPPDKRPSITDVAKLMGHSDAKTTLAIYAHAFETLTPVATAAVTDVTRTLSGQSSGQVEGNIWATSTDHRPRQRVPR